MPSSHSQFASFMCISVLTMMPAVSIDTSMAASPLEALSSAPRGLPPRMI